MTNKLLGTRFVTVKQTTKCLYDVSRKYLYTIYTWNIYYSTETKYFFLVTFNL